MFVSEGKGGFTYTKAKAFSPQKCVVSKEPHSLRLEARVFCGDYDKQKCPSFCFDIFVAQRTKKLFIRGYCNSFKTE